MPSLVLNPSYWYLATAGVYLLLALQALAGGTTFLQGHRLLLGLAGVAWGLYFGWLAPAEPTAGLSGAGFVIQGLFLFGWFSLLYRLLRGPYKQSMPETVRRALLLFWGLVVLAGVLVTWLSWSSAVPATGLYHLLVLSLALACLALSAQLHRDAPIEDQTALRSFTWAGALLGGSQAINYGIHALAPLGSPSVIALQCLPVALAGLLVMRAARRSPQWSLAIFVSPRARAYAPRLFGMLGILGVVLALMPLLRVLPEGPAGALAVIVIVLLGVPATALLFSENLSARLRVFISKHFLPFRYDYREEWLRLIDTLASPVQRLPLPERAIKAVAQIVGSPAGVLWLRRADGDPFICAAHWNTRAWPDNQVASNDAMLEFMRERQWILDTAELNRDPELYAGLERPDWLERFPDALLIVPLISNEAMIGFIVLFQSSSAFRLTFEDIDLLRTSGRQVAAYLAQYQADQQLAEAQQFEAFNRLTAFVMHDLKNLIAQQSLVVRNAARHKDNPAFFEDAIATIENSVGRMNRLLRQLQAGDVRSSPQQVRLAEALREAVSRTAGRQPEATLVIEADDALASAERERLVAVVAHLIRNAQDATPPDGKVTVTLSADDAQVSICIEDDGTGMEAEFIRSRLFRPFDSTKGSKGMGIGAYQARAFANDSGGALEVWSEPGRGSRFSIRLPLAAEPARPPVTGSQPDWRD